MKKYLLLSIACCLSACCLLAQVKKADVYNKELSFTTENDAYLFNKADAYYTNGFFLKYTKAAEHHGKKIIHAIEAGQEIFTPLIRLTRKAADIDRPYTGFLYLRYNHTSFTEKSVLQYGITLGTIGPNSFGKDIQNWYHNLLDYGKFAGWGYQLQNAVGVDLHVSLKQTLLEDSSWIKLMPQEELKLGTSFTNASAGMILCIGNFSNNANSALWNARVQPKTATTGNRRELFFYAYPQIILQGYNATVEGGLFVKTDSAAVPRTTSRWMFQQSMGVCYAEGRWTTRVAYIFQTREAVEQTNPHWYGSFSVGYRIR